MTLPFKRKQPKHHAAILLEDDPLYLRLDPRPLRLALTLVKESKAARLDSVETLARWKADLIEWERVADVRSDDDVRQGSLLRDKIHLLPREMAREDEKLAGLVDDLVKEEKAFEDAFHQVNAQEAEAKADEIEKLLKPFCVDYHGPQVTGSKRVNQARSVAFQCGVFGYFAAPLARVMHAWGYRGNYILPDKPEAVDAFDNQVIARAEELLASFSRWAVAGGKSIPATLPDCLPAQ